MWRVPRTEAGWELVRGYEFDAIVLDVMLPKMSGELARNFAVSKLPHRC